MAQNDANVRVRLDTKGAKSDLRDMTKEAQRASARVGQRIRGAASSALGAAGLGGGIALGAAAIRGPTSSGFGAALGESLGGVGAFLERRILGEKGLEARADASARAETINAFGAVIGHNGGKIPEGAKNFFDQVRSMRLEEEKGRQAIEGDSRFRTVEFDELIGTITTNIRDLVMEGIEALIDKIF